MVPAELEFSFVTSPSRPILMGDRALTRRQARRLSRRFDGVGVAIPAMRLQQIAAGGSAGGGGITDGNLAPPPAQAQRQEGPPEAAERQPRPTGARAVPGAPLPAVHTRSCLAA